MKESDKNHFRILVVDDDTTILEVYKRILERHTSPATVPSFNVTYCSQGDAALNAVKHSIQVNAPYCVVFLDFRMPPGPDGQWTAEEIHKLDSKINIVMVTGYRSTDSDQVVRKPIFSNNLLYLQKPFYAREIVQFAKALSMKWQAENELLTLQSDLENLVESRTNELIKSNQQLKNEIENRKRMQQQLQLSFENLKTMMNSTIQAIAMTVEKRDPYTSGHQQRVADLTRIIAEGIELSENQIEGAYMAAAIHDIGKISLPAEILSKPTMLSDPEISLIQTHSRAGYDILKSIEFPWPIAEIVLQHHERMDGSGYPQGLSNDNILIEARIIGVADVVETMASHRPYRPSLGVDKALEEVRHNRGILYDPQAVDVCLKLFQEKNFDFPPP